MNNQKLKLKEKEVKVRIDLIGQWIIKEIIVKRIIISQNMVLIIIIQNQKNINTVVILSKIDQILIFNNKKWTEVSIKNKLFLSLKPNQWKYKCNIKNHPKNVVKILIS